MAASTFKDYHGGVFSGCPYDQNIQLNHAVQLVGYGSDFSPAGVVDYWLVRNSWGESWGENGYIRFSDKFSLSTLLLGSFERPTLSVAWTQKPLDTSAR